MPKSFFENVYAVYNCGGRKRYRPQDEYYEAVHELITMLTPVGYSAGLVWSGIRKVKASRPKEKITAGMRLIGRKFS